MSDARKVSESTGYKLRHSQAITSVVQNIHPSTLLAADHQRDTTREDEQIAELYCTVSDKSVCDAVYDSYFDSKDAGHLIYVYNNITDEHRRTRVRILTKMLWYMLNT